MYISFGGGEEKKKIALILLAQMNVFLPDVPFSPAHMG